LLFGVGDYASGIESTIDPTAPARKAELVVAQGSVRLNLIIKRKNRTLKDIFKRWFLLYKMNMPPNKFMRIAGDDKDNPWKFESVSSYDFALNSIPDFELTGNILNANKTLEAQKKIGLYRLLSADPFFMPQTQQGMMAHLSLLKWLIDGLDETGLSSILPSSLGEQTHTPEEENARFLQGDIGNPTPNDDDVDHARKHYAFILDPSLPPEIKKNVIEHIEKHTKQLQAKLMQQIAMSQAPMQPQMGGQGGQAVNTGQAEVGTGAGIREPGMGVNPQGNTPMLQ
jgi:hypothetical protein